jgi:hypothetical protein
MPDKRCQEEAGSLYMFCGATTSAQTAVMLTHSGRLDRLVIRFWHGAT